jgi:hypothetical protein
MYVLIKKTLDGYPSVDSVFGVFTSLEEAETYRENRWPLQQRLDSGFIVIIKEVEMP